MKKLIATALGAALVVGGAAPAATQPGVAGMWINPHGTVAVRTGACGEKLCGWIVWANQEARNDAKDSGVDPLVGVQLLSDYEPQQDGSWSGTVYVPDMGRHFSSTITQQGPNALRVKGCLIGGFICKSQVWQRIEKLPNA